MLDNIFSPQAIEAIGWTLLYFIWQGAVIAVLLATALRLLRKVSANMRYAAACSAMILFVVSAVVTMQIAAPARVNVPVHAEIVEPAGEPPATAAVEEVPGPSKALTAKLAQIATEAPSVSWKERIVASAKKLLPHIVFFWTVGVLLLSVWHLGGWAQLQRLRRRLIKPVSEAVQANAKRLAELIGVPRAVELTESALVQVPTVIGWLKPLILLPASALTGLSGEQLEAILAHELAHIRRYDYLVNMFQTVIEIVGFYHPAVWWVSHRIRIERENCCDDIAVRVSGDGLGYAKALTAIEELRGGHRLAVAASGGSLLDRVRRLVGSDLRQQNSSGRAPALIAVLLVLALAVPITIALTSDEGVNLPVRFIASDNDGKVERYHWRLNLTKAVRLSWHSFKIEGDSIGGYWGGTNGTLTSPSNGTNVDYQLIISKEGDNLDYLMRRIQSRQDLEGYDDAATSSRKQIALPECDQIRTYILKQPVGLSEKYLPFWKRDFIKDGRVILTLMYAVRIEGYVAVISGRKEDIQSVPTIKDITDNTNDMVEIEESSMQVEGAEGWGQAIDEENDSSVRDTARGAIENIRGQMRSLPVLADDSLNNLPGDSLILKVLGQKIYLKDINPSQAQMEKHRNNKTQEEFDRWLQQQRKSNISGYFRVLFERYTQEQGVEVTDTDVEQFNKSMQRTISSQIEEAQKKINSLEKELKADNLDNKKRSELNNRLDIYSKRIKRRSKSKKVFEGRNSAVERTIIGWKINNQLYKQYGGRVIFQQAGPEPLDAYRKFFEDQQSKGHFEFYNKQAEELFWDYYRNEKIHTFYSDTAEAKNMMDTPWWLHEPEETLSREDVILWGHATNGFQARIRTRKLAFRTDETATIIVDLLNTGDDEFLCSPHDLFFEIEVDGRWYKQSEPGYISALVMFLPPKKIRYDFAEIKLTDQWLSKEKESVKLNLSLGIHAIRIKYKTMPDSRLATVKTVSNTTVEAVSNQIRFKILPPKSKKNRKDPRKKPIPRGELDELVELKEIVYKNIETEKLVKAVSYLHNRRKHAKTVDAGKEVLKRNLTDKQGAEVRFYMAKSYEALSDGPLVRQTYQEIIELYPEYERNLEIASKLGQLHSSTIIHGTERDVEKAIKWFRYAIDNYSNPDTFYWEVLRAHMGLGNLLCGGKEHLEAKKHYEFIYSADSTKMMHLPYGTSGHRKHNLKMLFIIKQAARRHLVSWCVRSDTKESEENLKSLVKKFSNDYEIIELAEIELEKLKEREF